MTATGVADLPLFCWFPFWLRCRKPGFVRSSKGCSHLPFTCRYHCLVLLYKSKTAIRCSVCGSMYVCRCFRIPLSPPVYWIYRYKTIALRFLLLIDPQNSQQIPPRPWPSQKLAESGSASRKIIRSFRCRAQTHKTCPQQLFLNID